MLAYAAAAVPETLGGAGIAFDEKRFALLAELAVQLRTDRGLRARVLAGQRRRLEALGPGHGRAAASGQRWRAWASAGPSRVRRQRRRPRVGIVVQRYGPGVTGGAEAHAAQVVTRLLPHWDIRVLTSCATDHLTWANALPPGESDGGRRARSSASRIRARGRCPSSTRCRARLFGRSLDRAEEENWMALQGPLLPGLWRHLAEHGRRVRRLRRLHLPLRLHRLVGAAGGRPHPARPDRARRRGAGLRRLRRGLRAAAGAPGQHARGAGAHPPPIPAACPGARGRRGGGPAGGAGRRASGRGSSFAGDVPALRGAGGAREGNSGAARGVRPSPGGRGGRAGAGPRRRGEHGHPGGGSAGAGSGERAGEVGRAGRARWRRWCPRRRRACRCWRSRRSRWARRCWANAASPVVRGHVERSRAGVAFDDAASLVEAVASGPRAASAAPWPVRPGATAPRYRLGSGWWTPIARRWMRWRGPDEAARTGHRRPRPAPRRPRAAGGARHPRGRAGGGRAEPEPVLEPLSFLVRRLEENEDPTVGLPIATHRDRPRTERGGGEVGVPQDLPVVHQRGARAAAAASTPRCATSRRSWRRRSIRLRARVEALEAREGCPRADRPLSPPRAGSRGRHRR